VRSRFFGGEVERAEQHDVDPETGEVKREDSVVPRERRGPRRTLRVDRGKSTGKRTKSWRSFDRDDDARRTIDFRLGGHQRSRRKLSKRAQGHERRQQHGTVLVQSGRWRPRRSRLTFIRVAKARAGVSNQNDTRRSDQKLCSPGQRSKRTHNRW